MTQGTQEAPEAAVMAAFCAVLCTPEAPTTAELDRVATGYHQPLRVYRAMVHNRLRRVIADYLPRTAEHLGKPRLAEDVARFLAESGPRSAHFRHVPGEFLAWVRPYWQADASLPAFLGDLAAHEWLDGEVGDSEAGGEPETGCPLAVDRPVVLDGSTRVRRYEFAVHRVADDPPVREPTAVLAYRDRTRLRLRILELSPRAATLCEELSAGATLQAALVQASAAAGAALDDAFLADMAGFLADLAERGVLLGARPV